MITTQPISMLVGSWICLPCIFATKYHYKTQPVVLVLFAASNYIIGIINKISFILVRRKNLENDVPMFLHMCSARVSCVLSIVWIILLQDFFHVCCEYFKHIYYIKCVKLYCTKGFRFLLFATLSWSQWIFSSKLKIQYLKKQSRNVTKKSSCLNLKLVTT